MGMAQTTAPVSTQTGYPEGTLFILNTKAGTNAEGFERVGFVVRNTKAQWESYNVVDAEGNPTDLTIDKSKAGDLYLKQKNPGFNPDIPRDLKTNNFSNIVTQLYSAMSKKSKETYYRATVGILPDEISVIGPDGKKTLKPGCVDNRMRYFLFTPNHGRVAVAPGILG